MFIAPEGREEEIVTRLSRVGYDNTLGYLSGGMAAWKAAGKDTEQVTTIPAHQFAGAYKEGGLNVMDVRKPSEFEAEHVEDAMNLPLDFISENMDQVDKKKQYHIHCAGGYRSMIAASILKSRGFDNIVDVAGGFKAISETDIPTTNYVCPSTLK